MNHQIIASVSDLLFACKDEFFATDKGRWVFRGHSNCGFDLIPSVGRGVNNSVSLGKKEKSLFDFFVREAPAVALNFPSDNWEILSLAQHHGLPTRLLDWSLNPLISLYFAVEANPESDGMLYALYAPKKTSSGTRAGSPFEIRRATKYLPKQVTQRLKAQEGLFVVCANPSEPLENSLRDDWRIVKFQIPATSKKALQYELFRIGVHASALFPDIDGLSARIRWQHTVKPIDEQG
jgi:type I restriction enzyme M protein